MSTGADGTHGGEMRDVAAPLGSGAREPMYFNPAQMEAMVVGARYEYIVGGRGLGKSEGFDARALLRNAFAMPGSTGALLSPSFVKMRRQTFPAMARALERWGYREGVHYFFNRRPPREARFGEPRIKPFSWENTLCFYNGSLVHMVSFDRAMATNSMSLDYIIGPEARFLPYERIVEDVWPAVRGNREVFGGCPWHGGCTFTTDMPTDRRGGWILEKARDMDPGLIQEIKREYLRMKLLERYRARGAEGEYRTSRRRLQELRAGATFFARYSSLYNVEILGEEWFAQQCRDLPRSVFSASIMSTRSRTVANAFYPSFDRDRNTYLPEGFRPGLDARGDVEIDPSLPLLVANDYNASINTMVCGQMRGGTLWVLREFFVKNPLTLENVVQKFVDYYGALGALRVFFFYDSTAVARSAASGFSFSDVEIAGLRGGGFDVLPIYVGQPARHAEKYQWINSALTGGGDELPRVLLHREGCAALIEALGRARAVVTRGGFGKDKGEERLPDTPELPDELKTHITDAFDTLFYGAAFACPGVADGTLGGGMEYGL